MHSYTNRRGFLKTASLAGLGFAMPEILMTEPIRIGIIGLDTQHSVAFTKVFNEELIGFRVMGAYPYGSRDGLLR